MGIWILCYFAVTKMSWPIWPKPSWTFFAGNTLYRIYKSPILFVRPLWCNSTRLLPECGCDGRWPIVSCHVSNGHQTMFQHVYVSC